MNILVDKSLNLSISLFIDKFIKIKKLSKQNSKSKAKSKVNLGRIKKQNPQFNTLDV